MRDRALTLRPRSIAALVLIFLFTLPAVTTRFYASDEVEFYAWLRSAAFDRDADFDNEYRYFHDTGPMRNAGFRTTFLDEVNEAGRRRNFTPIGTAVLWAPFFLAGHLAAIATGAAADGYSAPYLTAVTWGTATYGFLALLLSYAIVRRVIGGEGTSVVLIWIGTPLVFYMYVAPGFSHAPSAFVVALFLWVWLSVRERWTPAGAATLGVVAALMVMVREQDAFFVVGPAIDFVRWAAGGKGLTAAGRGEPSRPSRSAVVTAFAGIGAAALAYLPQLLAYQALNGHPGPTRDVGRKMTWTSPHFLEVLGSPEHGLFFWTPLALIGILGLVWLAVWRRHDASPDARWIGVLALVMVASQAYISGSVESWTVAGSFGQRRFVALTPLLALGIAAWSVTIRALRQPAIRALWIGVVVLSVWWNVGLMAQFALHVMDRQRLTLRQNARATFVDVPAQLPSLLLRYFTDRDSFYGRPRQ